MQLVDRAGYRAIFAEPIPKAATLADGHAAVMGEAFITQTGAHSAVLVNLTSAAVTVPDGGIRLARYSVTLVGATIP